MQKSILISFLMGLMAWVSPSFGQAKKPIPIKKPSVDVKIASLPTPLKVNRVRGLQLLAKHKNSKMVLRWAPLSPQLWQIGNQFGYTLERSTIKRGTKILNKPEDIVTKKLLPNSVSAWATLAQKVKYAKVVKNFLYDDAIPTTEKDTAIINNALRARHVLSLLCADFSPETANLMQLSFTDSSAKRNEIYRYKIKLNTQDGSVIEDLITAGLDLNIPQFSPRGLIDSDFADSTTTLKWSYPKFGIFSAYNIERSDDRGVTFQKVNEEPFLPLENARRFEEIVYSNKVPSIHKTYYYRVRGIDPFGDESDASNVVSVFAYQSSLVGGQNITYNFPNRSYLALKWKFPDSLNINIKGFNIYKSKDFKELKKVNVGVIPQSTHYYLDNVDENAENMYYFVSTVDVREKETQSEPMLVTIIDTIPPAKVTNLQGVIDKKGIVKITWKSGSEKDRYNFNIFRAEGNAPKSMFVIKPVEGEQTVMVDTIPMRASSRKIYYMVVPIDNHSNASLVNDTLMLIRPDIFPPEAPRFVSKFETDSALVVGWELSSSEDVEKYRLYKRNLPDTTKRLLTTFDYKKTVKRFYDVDFEEECLVQYVLEAIDFEGLSSYDSCRLDVKILKPLRIAAVTNLSGKVIEKDKEKKAHLKWQYYSKKPLGKFMIFREIKGGSSSKIGEVSGEIREFFDDKVKSDENYIYTIIALRSDGIRSFSGTPFSLKVK